MSEEVLGKDIRLNLEDLDISYGFNNDFSIIQGYNNLNQAIGMRFRTPFNTMLTHPDYGSNLPSLRGADETEETLSQAILYAYESLNQEPRVNEILDVDAQFTVIDGETYIQVSCSVIPIENDNALNIIVVIS